MVISITKELRIGSREPIRGSPLNPTNYVTLGQAALKVASSKMSKYEKACSSINMLLYHLLLTLSVS